MSGLSDLTTALADVGTKLTAANSARSAAVGTNLGTIAVANAAVQALKVSVAAACSAAGAAISDYRIANPAMGTSAMPNPLGNNPPVVTPHNARLAIEAVRTASGDAAADEMVRYYQFYGVDIAPLGQ